MVKMVLTVPHKFNAALFLDVVTEIVNNGRDNADGNYKYEYSLGDCLSWRNSETPYFTEYEIDADLIDFEVIDAIKKMQELCPPVNIHFENDGKPAKKSSWYDEYYFDNARFELYRHC